MRPTETPKMAKKSPAPHPSMPTLGELMGLGFIAALLAVSGCRSMGLTSSPPTAVCDMAPLDASGVHGRVTFTQEDDDVLVVADLDGLAPGKHGIHIHEHGDCSGPGGAGAGGHFNPTHESHGMAGMSDSHEGDLGNIVADANGHAHLLFRDKMLRFSGDESILGRSVVVHAQEDDLVSQPAGNSGARVACGLISAAVR